MSWPLSIPPATNETLTSADSFQFTATVACKICFGAPLAGVTHTFNAGDTWGPPVPRPGAGSDIPYNVVTPPSADCNQTGHIIHVGS